MNNLNHLNACNQNQCPTEDTCQLDLFAPQEAFMLGNAFRNLYDPYRSIPQFEYKPTTPRDCLLLQVDILEFYAHEMNLYLDTHPQDQNALAIFIKYSQLAQEAREKFECQFGPLTVNNSNNPQMFTWISKPWPWQRERMCH